jgi:hypothetical protein
MERGPGKKRLSIEKIGGRETGVEGMALRGFSFE